MDVSFDQEIEYNDVGDGNDHSGNGEEGEEQYTRPDHFLYINGDKNHKIKFSGSGDSIIHDDTNVQYPVHIWYDHASFVADYMYIEFEDGIIEKHNYYYTYDGFIILDNYWILTDEPVPEKNLKCLQKKFYSQPEIPADALVSDGILSLFRVDQDSGAYYYYDSRLFGKWYEKGRESSGIEIREDGTCVSFGGPFPNSNVTELNWGVDNDLDFLFFDTYGEVVHEYRYRVLSNELIIIGGTYFSKTPDSYQSLYQLLMNNPDMREKIGRSSGIVGEWANEEGKYHLVFNADGTVSATRSEHGETNSCDAVWYGYDSIVILTEDPEESYNYDIKYDPFYCTLMCGGCDMYRVDGVTPEIDSVWYSNAPVDPTKDPISTRPYYTPTFTYDDFQESLVSGKLIGEWLSDDSTEYYRFSTDSAGLITLDSLGLITLDPYGLKGCAWRYRDGELRVTFGNLEYSITRIDCEFDESGSVSKIDGKHVTKISE